MIETSRWIFHIDNMFMHEDLTAQLEVAEDGAVTVYSVSEKGLRPFPKEIADKIEFSGDTMSSEFPIKDSFKASIEVTFGENEAKGFFKFPLIGKLKFDGERIELTDLPVLPPKTTEEIMGKATGNNE